MPAPAKIVDLRSFLAERFPSQRAPTHGRLNSGLPFFDQATGGGLPIGALTELISPEMSAGSASLIHTLLSAARNRHFVAFIDGHDSFDVEALGNDSVRHLLWVRCTKASEAIKAADLLLRDGNFALVIVDLISNQAEEIRKIPQTSWYRLQRLVELVPSACLILSRQSMVSSAQLKIVVENWWSLKTLEEQAGFSQFRFHIQRFAGAIFTAGGRELIANRSREAGDSVLVKTERSHLSQIAEPISAAG